MPLSEGSPTLGICSTLLSKVARWHSFENIDDDAFYVSREKNLPTAPEVAAFLMRETDIPPRCENAGYSTSITPFMTIQWPGKVQR